jgi:1-aminocyclopropane-1-carboxylate deaminase
MQELLIDTIRIESLKNMYQPYNVEVDVLRLDKIHPIVSGNKWFKLKEYLKEAERSGKKNILTFGGAWSNHILATAAACKIFNLKTIGIIRGERAETLSDTLQDAINYEMKLFFINRTEYSNKLIPTDVWKEYNEDETFIIPEGGYGITGCKGARDISKLFSKNYSYILTACGTGTTLAGLINSLYTTSKVVGISVLKNNLSLNEDVTKLLKTGSENAFSLIHDYHCGGYAKTTKELISFMNDFYSKTSIPTDIVYTSKLFYAVDQLIKTSYFPKYSKILIIHSGGLQGNRSLAKGTLIF